MADGYRGAATAQVQPERESPPTETAVTMETPLICGGYVSVQ
jgi:hypothetical protein